MKEAQTSLTGAGLSRRQAKPAEVVISRATVNDPVAEIDGVYDIVIAQGRIERLAPPGEAEAGPDTELIEAEGLHAFPAFFDPHVHLRTPGQEHKEDLETGTRAAAAGGYCGVIAMANTSPPVSDPSQITALIERARAIACVPVGFLGTVTVGMEGSQLSEMAALAEAGALGYSDDGLPIRDSGLMRRALQYQRYCGGRIALHQEDPQLSLDGVMHEGAVSARLGLAGVPAVSEQVMVERDLALAEYEGGAIQLQHLSAAESVTAVAAAKSRQAAGDSAEGFSVIAEATPHHLCLTDEAVADLDPARHKMNPPLRAESDRQALLTGLRQGTIECIATDHAPHAAEDKLVPYEQAAMGVTGLEVAFAALHTWLIRPGVLGLDLVLERLTAGAEPFGLPRPSLAPGSEANLTLCDLEMEWVPGEEGYESRSANCWCDGERLIGRPVVTVAGGQVAYRLRSFSMGVAR